MATNQTRWVKSLLGLPNELILPGKFQTGTAIKKGQLLELSAGYFIPLASDKAMSATVAIAGMEVKSDYPTGYYPIIVPRPGDIFQFALDSAGANALGAAMYVSGATAEVVTATVGTNIIGHVAGWAHYSSIYPQNPTTDTGAVDKGTTVGTQARVDMTIKAACSYYAALQL